MILINNMLFDINHNKESLKKAIADLAYVNPEYVMEDILDEAYQAIDSGDEIALDNVDLWEMDIVPTIVNEEELIQSALESVGYQVTKSNHGVSLYAVNDDGKEVRISDHKRPSIVEGNVAIYEHDEGFITPTIKVPSDKLINLGFSKLARNKTLYLG